MAPKIAILSAKTYAITPLPKLCRSFFTQFAISTVRANLVLSSAQRGPTLMDDAFSFHASYPILRSALCFALLLRAYQLHAYFVLRVESARWSIFSSSQQRPSYVEILFGVRALNHFHYLVYGAFHMAKTLIVSH